MDKKQGKEYWRSLEQIADTPEFRSFLHREFPEHAWELDNSISRRNFISIMGASLALAGLTGCRRPVDKIVPYVAPPEELVPGQPSYYATSMPFGVGGYGLVVETHEGRPTKIEGNQLHPSTMGASSAIVQASLLGLYDPDRSRNPLYRGAEKEWAEFVAFWHELYPRYLQNKGEGLAIIAESTSSPTFYKLYEEFLKNFPEADFVVYEAVNDENIYNGVKLAAGQFLQPLYHYDRAKVILSLDADFLLTESENIAATRKFSQSRRLKSEKDSMNRLYVVEGVYSLTGAMADHRLRLPSSEVIHFTVALAQELQSLGLTLSLADLPDSSAADIDKKWLNVLARDLLAAAHSALIVAGRRQPPAVHALVAAINHALGAAGNTVDYARPDSLIYPDAAAFAALAQKMESGSVSCVIILGGNPAYNAGADIDLKAALGKVEHSIHLSPYLDETSQLTAWHLPQSHFLESWGDVRSLDGTLGIIQPMIEPLYDSHSSLEVMSLLVTGRDRRGYDIVRYYWQDILKGMEYEKEWRKILHDGLKEGSAFPVVIPRIDFAAVAESLKKNLPLGSSASADNLEIVFTVSPSLFDGRFANNGWLQELPDSMTKLCWDNAALLSPKTADALGVTSGDMAQINYRGRQIEMPVWTMPGQADYIVNLSLGYGREKAGQVGNGVGFNSYRIRPSSSPDFGIGADIQKTGRRYLLVTTQDHQSMEGRPIVREATLEEYRREPDFAEKMVEHPPLVSIYTEHKYDEGYQWGMTIDLNVCTGCNACTIACQSENNIPIVGKEQVRRGREMHWIRNDRYFTGETDNPEVVHQPVTCQHCENAPCEQVCPVAATSHDREGLNVMTYNRCIGTRYCSNNCPYKVRRFNFFNYIGSMAETLKMAQNPDVTVRSRGVMEKCTFCIQRISRARITAKKENRTIRDGEVVTACQQGCPADAIVFGNINDPNSRVSQIKKQNRNYALLAELNTQPRNTYLAKVRNPHPELEHYKPTSS